jgi:hypothetical protein
MANADISDGNRTQLEEQLAAAIDKVQQLSDSLNAYVAWKARCGTILEAAADELYYDSDPLRAQVLELRDGLHDAACLHDLLIDARTRLERLKVDAAAISEGNQLHMGSAGLSDFHGVPLC